MKRMIQRINTLVEYAEDRNVRVMIDAEQVPLELSYPLVKASPVCRMRPAKCRILGRPAHPASCAGRHVASGKSCES